MKHFTLASCGLCQNSHWLFTTGVFYIWFSQGTFPYTTLSKIIINSKHDPYLRALMFRKQEPVSPAYKAKASVLWMQPLRWTCSQAIYLWSSLEGAAPVSLTGYKQECHAFTSSFFKTVMPKSAHDGCWHIVLVTWADHAQEQSSQLQNWSPASLCTFLSTSNMLGVTVGDADQQEFALVALLEKSGKLKVDLAKLGKHKELGPPVMRTTSTLELHPQTPTCASMEVLVLASCPYPLQCRVQKHGL